MKKILAVAVLAALGGCSSLSNMTLNEKVDRHYDESDPIKERVITTEWEDDGVKISYTLLGELDEIEATAMVPAYVANYKVVGESEVRRKLVEFVHGSKTQTVTNVDIIGQTLDLAVDNKLDNYIQSDGDIDAEKIEADIASNEIELEDSKNKSGTSTQRTAKAIEKHLTKETRKVSSSGRLVGWLIGGEPSEDGKHWISRMKWTRDTQQASDMVRTAQR